MSDQSTIRMISAYLEQAPAPMFLSGMFQSPVENYHTTEKVELDVERDNEEVAIVITSSVQDGYRDNEFTQYVNKSFTPPIYNERAVLSASDLLKRMPGRTPFEDPVFLADMTNKAFKVFQKLENKVNRAKELMASQVLTTGKLTLKDAATNTVYSLDYSPKNTHYVTTTAWAADGSTGDPIGDIAALAVVLQRDGKKVPDQLIFGANGAWPRFLNNANVKQYLGRLGYGLGQIGQGEYSGPPMLGKDSATYLGNVIINNYRYECWMYNGYYKDPNTGNFTAYVPDNKVIVRASSGRLDLSYGAIPRFVQPDPRVMGFLPPRISSPTQQVDITPNAWLSPDGTKLNLTAGTRPLTIPTAIDTFGCLTVY